jgi:hypothetical protein
MTTTPAQLSGLFKEAYGDDVYNLIPDVAKIVKMVSFIARDKEEGNKYHQPVIVSSEHGVTYAAPSAGAFTLNAAISMNMQDAQVEGSQLLLRSALSYDAAAKASNSKKAFMKATELLVENMLESITKRLEISILYGGSGIGVADSSVNASATSTVIQLTTASWASGIWSGAEQAQLNFYNIPADTLVSSGADAIFTVSAVDTTNRKITVTGTATGITALDAALGANDCNIYFKGSKGAEMTGINGILTNTGTLFNISAANWNLWKANTYGVGSAQLTMGKVLAGVATAVDRGLNEKVELFLNPKTWANLNSDLAALRRYDGSYSRRKMDNGAEAIAYYGQNGEIEVISHNCVKEGEAFALPMKRVKRLGAQDISFKTPGRGDDIFTQLSDSAGYELRCYTDQCVFLETPARAVKYTGIVNV